MVRQRAEQMKISGANPVNRVVAEILSILGQQASALSELPHAVERYRAGRKLAASHLTFRQPYQAVGNMFERLSWFHWKAIPSELHP